MKIIKKILLPLVLFLSLFFNTSTIFAGNNLSTTFNANNDELTVTVKNNSDKELSDVEYNLNLPSEYTVKYEVNPNYSLSPQEETTFKVKVSKSGDNVSNNGEQGTKTYTSSKKTLDNTGLTSELTVGVIILLFLLVGVILYFKQRKVFIILLVAGIGTQLFPRYSFAANKIRQIENFKEYVTLLENNIPISLDVSYLIEGDSNNNGNTTNSNGNNSGNNGLNSNDKDPKEVLVAGYAYSGKTNNILEEKELKVFDGDKEIATVKTDTEGYFFTHLIQDKTYTIKGEDFEVTVTAKNTGDYEHKDVVGKLTLGRILKDNVTNIKVKPSVAFINEDIEYKVEGNTVTIEGEHKLKEGDKLILSPNHTYLTGFAFIVNTTSASNGKTILTVTPITTLDSIVDDFKYSEKVDISSMKFTPAEGVKVLKNPSESVMYRDVGDISGTLSLEVEDTKVSIAGKFKYDISKSERKVIVEPEIEFGIEGKLYSKDKKIEREKKIGTLGYITFTGISVPIDIYLYVNVNGEVNLKYEFKKSSSIRLGYENNNWIFDPKVNSEFSISANLEGSLETGGKIKLPGTTLFGTVKVMNLEFILGPLLEGNLSGGVEYKDQKFGGKASGEAKLYAQIKGKAELDILEVFLNEKPSISKDIKIELWSKGPGDSTDNNNNSKNDEDNNNNNIQGTRYENKYFNIDVPNSWAEKWNVKEEDAKKRDENLVAYYSASRNLNPTGNGFGGVQEIFIMNTDKFKNSKLNNYAKLVGVTDENLGVYLGIGAGAGFFVPNGAKITIKNPKVKKIISSPDSGYNKVFEDLNMIDQNKGNLQKLFSSKFNINLQSWTTENIANNIDKISYAFYDIDKDGTNELILSGGENNGRYPITAYYLNNGNPGLLAESHVAGNGGSRMGFNLYSDGNIFSSSWSSGTGRGIATLLNLSNGKFTKIKTANIDNIYDLNSKSGSPESMGLSKNLQINLNSLSWKPIKQ